MNNIPLNSFWICVWWKAKIESIVHWISGPVDTFNSYGIPQLMCGKNERSNDWFQRTFKLNHLFVAPRQRRVNIV